MKLTLDNVTPEKASVILDAAEALTYRKPKLERLITGLFVWDQREQEYRSARLREVIRLLPAALRNLIWALYP